jgi:hypothetical protein
MTEIIDQTVNRVLSERVGEYGFTHATVYVGYDHDGDEALFIDAYYDHTEREIDPTAFYGLTSVVRAALDRIGEYRFPYIRHHFDAHQRVAV